MKKKGPKKVGEPVNVYTAYKPRANVLLACTCASTVTTLPQARSASARTVLFCVHYGGMIIYWSGWGSLFFYFFIFLYGLEWYGVSFKVRLEVHQVHYKVDLVFLYKCELFGTDGDIRKDLICAICTYSTTALVRTRNRLRRRLWFVVTI